METKSGKALLEETRFVNEFYPHQGQIRLCIAFEPTRLLSASSLIKYLSSKNYISDEQRELLGFIFGDGPSIAERLEHQGENDDGPDDPLRNWFEREGEVNIHISPTGKEATERTFYWFKYTYNNNIPLQTFVNFIHYHEGHFYAIQPSRFTSTLKSLAFESETRKLNKDYLESLCDEFNGEDYDNIGYDTLSTITFKSSKLTLSKVLISLLPDLDMKYIVELSDFINSEIMSKKVANKTSDNIFELKGELITYFYNSKNYRYPNEGTLGNSCMRGSGNTEQIRFYANNASTVSLLALIEDKKLLARSVLWTDINGKKFTDRIYCSSSKYGIRLAAYCKQKDYKTVYYGTNQEYGIEYDKACIVKIDSIELKNSCYPYLDSMQTIDIVNNIICTDADYLVSYLDSANKNYLLRSLRNGMFPRFSNKNQKDFKYLKDINGNSITNSLARYTIIKKPKLAVVDRLDVITINGGDKVYYKWCEDNLIKRYNSLRPVIRYNKDPKLKCTYTVHYYDKRFTVYSTYHKFYLLETDSVYLPKVKAYVLKDILDSTELSNYIRLIRLRRMYSGKLVRISPEGLSALKAQISLLPFKESLMDIRKSRVYSVQTKNILLNGVRIKGIIIPFKQLRFVKK